jgi:hypothetical protein
MAVTVTRRDVLRSRGILRWRVFGNGLWRGILLGGRGLGRGLYNHSGGSGLGLTRGLQGGDAGFDRGELRGGEDVPGSVDCVVQDLVGLLDYLIGMFLGLFYDLPTYLRTLDDAFLGRLGLSILYFTFYDLADFFHVTYLKG